MLGAFSRRNQTRKRGKEGPMRSASVFAALAALSLPAPAGASPRVLPQPPHEPLGVLVRDSGTIHVLQMESFQASVSKQGVGAFPSGGAAFKVTATLKGRA